MSNQFNKHPLPFFNVLTLASVSDVIAKDLAIAVPTTLLAIPAPAASAGNEPDTVRVLRGGSVGGGVVVKNDGAGAVGVEVIAKIGGVEYVLSNALAVAAGAVVNLGAPGGGGGFFPIIPSDAGVFVRLTPAAATVVQVFATYADVRNLRVQDVELEQGTKLALLSNSNDDANPFLDISTPLTLLNADAAAQLVDLTFDDGTDEISITPTAGLSVPGLVPPAVSVLTSPILIAVPEDGAVNATLRVSAATEPVLARVAYSETNSGPARPNQGGAY
jgi:hypothetical protein